MSARNTGRTRVMVDLTPEVHVAIKIRAARDGVTTGQVVCEAIQRTFAKETEDAKAALSEKGRLQKR